MLKWDYQPAKRSRSWIATIGEQRRRLRQILEDSPSLVFKARAELGSRYANAIEAATAETGLALETFPPTCPYTWQEIFNREFALTAPSPDSPSRPS